ncbi:MAG: hypothetical protein A3I09_00960 [Deltaproteobacteria bacterium RIFCSPLOWO2_02_FULL_47_10]|nr:MAG: hypothetical protein A3I09_00960 [Deltaproteobacteria bacterium RIFCSPLOWO2_02_FULL_47_10]
MNILNLLLMIFLGVSTALASETLGNIEGEVRLEGELPKGNTPTIVEYQGPCGAKKSVNVVRLWKKRVMDVTLWLTSESAKNEQVTEEDTTVTGYKCEFWPKMTVIHPGAKIKIENKDPHTQWLVIENGGKKEQIMQEADKEPVEKEIADSKIHLSSGFYPWMEAWVKPVADLATYTETEWDGRFFFKNIPPGEYILHSWHPVLGEIEQNLTVEADKELNIDVTYPPLDEKVQVIIEATMLEKIMGRDGEENDNPFKK